MRLKKSLAMRLTSIWTPYADEADFSEGTEMLVPEERLELS